MNYQDFLNAKIAEAKQIGFDVSEADISDRLKPHQKAIVRWMVSGGRRACFAAFGLGETSIQLEAVRLTLQHAGGRGLIVCPLGVRQEFRREASERLGWAEAPRFIRSIDEADETGIYLTNYETVRDGKIDPNDFTVASLDEAAILRGFGGSKTFREFMALFAGDDRSGTRTRGIPYRFVATATPSPNEYIELLAYAAYLDVMDVAAAKTRFFKRDSTKADNLTIHPHKEAEFWLWVASWAVFVQKPSDLGVEFGRRRGRVMAIPSAGVRVSVSRQASASCGPCSPSTKAEPRRRETATRGRTGRTGSPTRTPSRSPNARSRASRFDQFREVSRDHAAHGFHSFGQFEEFPRVHRIGGFGELASTNRSLGLDSSVAAEVLRLDGFRVRAVRGGGVLGHLKAPWFVRRRVIYSHGSELSNRGGR